VRTRRTILRLVAGAAALGFGALPAPVSAASNKWSHVTALEPGSQVIVRVVDGGAASGRVVATTSDSVTVRAMGEDEVIPRDRVLQVVRIRKRGSVPIVIAAVAGGLVISGAIAYACISQEGQSCGNVDAAVLLIPPALGTLAYKLTLEEKSKVIYERPEKEPARATPPGRGDAASAGLNRRDAVSWEAIRRALPPSLQGRRSLRASRPGTDSTGASPQGRSS
jgi:hypothetical protein